MGASSTGSRIQTWLQFGRRLTTATDAVTSPPFSTSTKTWRGTSRSSTPLRTVLAPCQSARLSPTSCEAPGTPSQNCFIASELVEPCTLIGQLEYNLMRLTHGIL